MTLALPVILCLASGFLLVGLGWRTGAAISNYVLAGSLSVGFGLGISSFVFFLCLLLGVTHLVLIDAGVFALLLVSFLVLRTRSPFAVRQAGIDQPTWLPRLLIIAFALALCAALYSAVMRTLAYPHGEGWDPFAIWN